MLAKLLILMINMRLSEFVFHCEKYFVCYWHVPRLQALVETVPSSISALDYVEFYTKVCSVTTVPRSSRTRP